MLTREEAKAVVDKVLNLAKADAVEVNLSASERSGTRWANSTITTNLVQYDRNLTVTVRLGQKVGTASTRDWSDDGIKTMIAEALTAAEKAQESPNLPELLGAQIYLPVDGAPAEMINLGPAERARMVKASLDVAAARGVVGAGFIPKNDVATCTANSKGLFAYFRSADVSFALTCRMADGSGSGWAGAMGIKDMRMLDPHALTEIAASKALKSRKAKALEPGRYTVILEPRANARFLSLVTGVFQSGGGGRGGAGGPGGPGGPGGAAGAPGGAPGAGRSSRRCAGCRRWRWWRRWLRRWRGGGLPQGQEAGRQDLQRSLHAQERCRQFGPAPVADPRHLQAGGASDVGGKWSAAEHHQQSAGRIEQFAGAGRQRTLARGDDQADAARLAGHPALVHPRRAGRGTAVAQHRDDARRPLPDRERRDRRPGAELPLEHVAARRLQQFDAGGEAGPDGAR
ncbi:MAG: hypothetical protein IPO52_00620 [Gemmatimonadetes bacterium]|nr:hypothetical protein [Gemmatimonadota bacterium]